MEKKEFFSQGWMALGARPEMTFEQRIAANFVSWAGLAMGFCGLAFALLNLLQRHFALAAFNLSAAVIGLQGVLLIARGRLGWALGLLCGAGFVTCFLQAFLLHNGNEILLLVLLSLTAHLTISVFLRRLAALLIGIAYLIIQADRLHAFPHPGVTSARFLLNVAIGLVSIYAYHAMIQAVTRRYRQAVEAKNRELDAQRRILQEERSKLREANSAKERLFSILAHDLCSPVGHLQEALAYLEDGHLSEEEFRALRQEFREEIGRVHASLHSLLEWSAQQLDAIAPRFASVDLGALCAEAVGLLKPLAGKRAILLENRIAPGTLARADRDQILAVFRNLFSNALKFTPSGGSVHAEAAAVPEKEAWQVTVRDTGIGIDGERAHRLFEGARVESTPGLAREKGLGLGLAICRDFIRAHHGEIRVETAAGRGTAIHFTLPRAETAA